jgi:hypothetical protein
MAELSGDLWQYNLAKVVIVDVSDDYRYMQSPMPGGFYPVLKEAWFPRHRLSHKLVTESLVQGYLYDWHEMGDTDEESWYVGVVAAELAAALPASA